MMAQRKETEGRWKRARERIGCASEMRERETKRGGTGAAKGVGIRFAADNASGSSQEIHGRGAEINVLLHLHSYLSSSVPRIPHLTPLFHSPTSPPLTLPLSVCSLLFRFYIRAYVLTLFADGLADQLTTADT